MAAIASASKTSAFSRRSLPRIEGTPLWNTTHPAPAGEVVVTPLDPSVYTTVSIGGIVASQALKSLAPSSFVSLGS